MALHQISPPISAYSRRWRLIANGASPITDCNRARPVAGRTPKATADSNRGFTLLEVIMVVALVATIGGLSAYFGIDSYRQYAFHSDRDLLVTALQHARAQAVGNICLPTAGGCTDGKSHGVAIYDSSFVVYQGTSSTTRDTDVDAVINTNPNTTHSGATDFAFTQLSATSSGGIISLVDSVTGRTSVITVGTEGEISWTN